MIWGDHDIALGAEMLDDLPEYVPDLTVRRLPAGVGRVQTQRPSGCRSSLTPVSRWPGWPYRQSHGV